MNNCLVTKLKAVVNNDNLKVFGMLKVKVSVGTFPANNLIAFAQSETMKVLGGTIDGLTQITGNSFYFENKTVVSDGTYDGYVVLLIPKYNITRFWLLNMFYDIDCNDLVNSPITSFYLNSNSFNNISSLQKFLANSNMASITGHAVDDTVLDISDLGKNGELTYFTLSGTTTLIGSLDNLGCSALSTSSGGMTFPPTKQVSFVVENFVANNRAKGRTTGSYSMLKRIGECNATIYGNIIQVKDSYSLSWTENTITLDGVTYDSNGNVI